MFASLFAMTLAIAPVADEFPTTFWDGNKLLQYCDVRQVDETYDLAHSVCLGFVVGVADTMLTIKLARNQGTCLPAGVSAGQLVAIFTQYASKAPQKRHYPAALLVLNSINEAFPECKATAAP